MDVLGKPMFSKFLADCFDDSVEVPLRGVSLAVYFSQLFLCERGSILRSFSQHDLTDFLMSINFVLGLGLVRTSILGPATAMLNLSPNLYDHNERKIQ